MSFVGFKKQISKANQLLNEKIVGAKGTELDADFVEMERNTDSCSRFFDEISSQTQSYLQPNPTSRALLMTRNALNKVQGRASQLSYPQPESRLGDCLIKYSQEIRLMPNLSETLRKSGETFQSLADHKYTLEDNVKQNFLHPLLEFQTRDMKEINFHRKKVNSRRLDYDCKRRQDKTGGESEDVRVAQNKFIESKELAEETMSNFFDNEVEMVQAFAGFLDATVGYHERALKELTSLRDEVKQQYEEAVTKPRRSIQTTRATRGTIGSSFMSQQSNSTAASEPVQLIGKESKLEVKLKTPCCRAVFDFNAENDQELAFREGDTIKLLEQLDENWYLGEFQGKEGHFPASYVEILVPL